VPNVGGSRYPARKLLVEVAAPVWSNATSRGSYLKGTSSVLRFMTLGLIT